MPAFGTRAMAETAERGGMGLETGDKILQKSCKFDVNGPNIRSQASHEARTSPE